MKPITVCVFRTGSTNPKTGKSELPDKCKKKGCCGDFIGEPDKICCVKDEKPETPKPDTMGRLI